MKTVQATLVRDTPMGFYVRLNGYTVWLQKSLVKFNKEEEELQIPEWLYELKDFSKYK